MSKLLPLLMIVCIAICAPSCRLLKRFGGKVKAAPVADSTAVSIVADTAVRTMDTTIVSTDSTNISSPAKDSGNAVLLQQWMSYWNAVVDFQTFSGKAKVQYKGRDEAEDFTATIRIERDKRLWVSVTAFGGMVEAVRALITPDTITLIDRFHREVRVVPFAEARKVLPFGGDFTALQTLIVGGVIHAVAGAPQVSEHDTGSAMLFAADSAVVQQVRFFRLTDSLVAIASQGLGGAQSGIAVTYSDFDTSSRRVFAKSRSWVIRDSASIDNIMLNFSKATFDEPVEMSFSIPEKYERK